MTGAVLVIPCCEKGKGGGHLMRCIKLTDDLRAAGCEAWLYLPDKTNNIIKFLQSKNFNASWIINNEQINQYFELVILDRYQTPREEFERWKKVAPLIGIDEGGPCRASFNFLIDILIPENFEKPPANITSCGLLDLPKKTKTAQDAGNNKNLKILISFGQEDATGLAIRAINKLTKKNVAGMEISLLKGVLNKSDYQIPDSVKILDSIPNLVDHLCEYDLVITHYGITAYEALYAGTKVLLDHPTLYHKKIAKAAGFMDINKIKIILTTNKHGQIRTKERLRAKSSFVSWTKNNETSLANLINSFSPQVNRSCPVCGNQTYTRSIARFPERTYRRCNNCGIIFMDRTCLPHIEYEKEYFFESYKRQYGKTYLEDFPNLVAIAKRRLKIIRVLLPVAKKRTLLDIGCAYGPFLAAAKEEGFSPSGIDPAQDAVRYVQESLSLPAVQGFFPDCQLPTPPFYNVITLWYVIEHFRDLATVLAEIKKLLKPDGILAFSTPSFSGISGSKSLLTFLEKSPADHYTIWSPKMCKKALALAGFKVKKIMINGHHPERFPILGKFAGSIKSPLYRPLFLISKIFGLGDTFEIYAKLN